MKFRVVRPILGFENIHYVELVKIDKIFAVLKDEKGNTLFSLINPFVFKEYSFDIPSDIKVLLNINESSKIEVYNNVVMKNPITKSIINFKAPFIFDMENLKCAQMVLDNEEFATIEDFQKIN